MNVLPTARLVSGLLFEAYIYSVCFGVQNWL